MNLSGVVLVFGYSAAAWVGFGSFYSTNPAFQWRFPLCLQCLWPLAMLCLTPWIPESPRWCRSLQPRTINIITDGVQQC
jgi:hypothetical protein